MSQSSTVLDYEVQQVVRARETPCPQDHCRLLGVSGRGDDWSKEQFLEVAPARLPLSSVRYVQAEAILPQPLLAMQEDIADTEPGIKHPVWLVGTLVGIAALATLVSPVFANSQPPGKLAISLSSYHSTFTGSGDMVVALPLVDVSTEGGEPASEAAPPPIPGPSKPGSYEVTGSPSISVRQIEVVLAQYGSPAVGQGAALHEAGMRHGIDPAYALAFFVHESSCGTKGVARSTRSIGNIRWTKGYDNFEGYRSYPTWQEGIEDWYRLISDLYIEGWNLRTVDAIVPVYAPYGDNNNPPAYIAAVKHMVDSWRGK